MTHFIVGQLPLVYRMLDLLGKNRIQFNFIYLLWYLVVFYKYHQHNTFNKTSFCKNNDTKKTTHLVTWKTLWNFIWQSKQTYIRSDMFVLLIANEFNYLHWFNFSFKYLVASWIHRKKLRIHGVIKTPAWLNLI